jgi:hypothetical protein
MNLNTTNPQLMKYLLLTATLLLLALLAGCKKEDQIPYPLSELPPATQTGARTFGCLINGEPWVAYAPWDLFGKLRAYYDEEHYGFDYNRRLIVGSHRIIPSYDLNNDSIANSLGFTINPIISEGYYDKQNLENYKSSFFLSKPLPSKIYELDTIVPFHIHITKLDTVKKIVSGTFEFDMRRISDSMDVLQIRHGRFDALYQKE